MNKLALFNQHFDWLCKGAEFPVDMASANDQAQAINVRSNKQLPSAIGAKTVPIKQPLGMNVGPKAALASVDTMTAGITMKSPHRKPAGTSAPVIEGLGAAKSLERVLKAEDMV